MAPYHRKRRMKTPSVPGNCEFRYVRRDGEVRHAFETVGMIPGTKRSAASVVDIMDLKRIQEELHVKSGN